MKIETDEQGGRIFFSSTGRSLEGEDEICILSVGVDIGSSTSHLVFSRIVLERLDSRYVVTERETFYQSDILLTPYTSEDAIDADALGAFFEKQYENALIYSTYSPSIKRRTATKSPHRSEGPSIIHFASTATPVERTLLALSLMTGAPSTTLAETAGITALSIWIRKCPASSCGRSIGRCAGALKRLTSSLAARTSA